MKILKIAGSAGFGLVLSTGVALAATPALYTAAQAKAGAGVYAQSCAMCHGADLKGGAGPDLLGQAFAAPSNHYTIGAIFSEVAEQMPAGQPGSLTHEQYDDVMAYLLQKNGYPAGAKPLDYSATLKSGAPLVSQMK